MSRLLWLPCFLFVSLHSYGHEPGQLKKVLPDFPKNLATPWDKGAKEGTTSQPSWFPSKKCGDAWKGKSAFYKFDFKRYGRKQYPLEKAKALGCQKSTEEETLNCLLTKAYADYQKALNAATKTKRRNCYKKWTILIAMDGSNDLHPYALWDLYEMEAKFSSDRAASTIRKDVVVQHDGADKLGIHRLHMFQTQQKYETKTTDFFEAKSQTVRTRQSPIIQVLPEAYKKTKQERFIDFIDWGMKAYPAEHYMVILWGHGQGWLSQKDKESSVHLSGKELADSLQQIYLTTLEGKRPIDNFVADACFMQGIELATQLSPYVRFISGSAQVQDFMGLPYRVFLYEMNASYPRLRERFAKQIKLAKAGNQTDKAKRLAAQFERAKKDEPLAVAETLPDLMAATLQRKGLQGRLDMSSEDYKKGLDFFTYASVDSAALRNQLVPALDGLATAIIQFIDEAKTDKELLARKDFFYLSTPKLQFFDSKHETRELGSTNTFLKLSIAKKYPTAAARRVARQAHAGLEKTPGVLKALERAIPSRRYSKSYEEKFKGYEKEIHFFAMGFWLPDNIQSYQNELVTFQKSLFFQYNPRSHKEGSAWLRMFKLIYEAS